MSVPPGDSPRAVLADAAGLRGSEKTIDRLRIGRILRVYTDFFQISENPPDPLHLWSIRFVLGTAFWH